MTLALPSGPQDSGKPKDGNSGNNDNPEPATEFSEPDKSAALAPPANWKTSDKEIFNTLPEPAQKFLLDRHKAMEADHTRKTQAIAEFRREYEPVDQLFAPHRAFMKERGITSREVIEYWADIERRLGQGDGVNVIKGIAQGYAIDPAQIAAAFGLSVPASANAGDQQTTSPAPAAAWAGARIAGARRSRAGGHPAHQGAPCCRGSRPRAGGESRRRGGAAAARNRHREFQECHRP